jgi:serine phosphatase RsbU (regulator of sigma subunit)
MQLASSAPDYRASIGGESILVGSRRRGGLVVYVSEFIRNIRDKVRAELWSRAGGIVLVGIALTAIVNLVLLHLVTRPIGRLVATVRRIGDGDLGITPRRSMTTELDDLALEIGAMSQSLAKADEYRRHQMAKARRIQHHLMPRADHLKSMGIHHVHLPADDVGGDFFDVKIINDHSLAVYIGDVTGHGVPAAMSAAMLKTLFEHTDSKITNPVAVLQQINRQFHAVTLDGDFATMFMGVIDRREGRLIYASAGHETGYVLRRDGRIDELNTSGLLLGIDPDAECETTEVSIDSGDTIVLLTDGLIETMSPEGRLLGRQAVVAAMANDASAPPNQESPHDLATRLLRLADDHRAGGQRVDDITLAILRV